jgi:hypothetical protein
MRRTSTKHGILAWLGALIIFVLVFGTLAGCGSRETGNLPASPEEADEIVVRVSGAEGTAYAGTYGNLEEEGVPLIIEDTLGGEPTEYEVEIEEGVSDGVSAFFEKTEPGSGGLEAEILADGEIVAKSTTYAEFGSVIVDWFPQTGPLEEGAPKDDP